MRPNNELIMESEKDEVMQRWRILIKEARERELNKSVEDTLQVALKDVCLLVAAIGWTLGVIGLIIYIWL